MLKCCMLLVHISVAGTSQETRMEPHPPPLPPYSSVHAQCKCTCKCNSASAMQKQKHNPSYNSINGAHAHTRRLYTCTYTGIMAVGQKRPRLRKNTFRVWVGVLDCCPHRAHFSPLALASSTTLNCCFVELPGGARCTRSCWKSCLKLLSKSFLDEVSCVSIVRI
jgi:hypothetical protein